MVAVAAEEGVTVSVVPHRVVAVDSSFGPAAGVSRVWLVAEVDEHLSVSSLGGNWTCPSCGARAYVSDGDEVPCHASSGGGAVPAPLLTVGRRCRGGHVARC